MNTETRLLKARATCTAVLYLAFAQAAGAQHAHPAHGGAAPAPHPHGAQQHGAYAGMQQRSIKALSEQQLADLRAGKGMGMALAAELNGYPGPLHTLELAERLGLSAEQKSRTEALFSQMQQEASRAGEVLIAAEQALDQLFRDRLATPDALRAAVSRSAQAQGALRETHLRYHLLMVQILSPQQVAAYQKMRGY